VTSPARAVTNAGGVRSTLTYAEFASLTSRSPWKVLAMPQPIVLIHGLWLTARSWEGWKSRCEKRGHEVLTPPWPRMEGEVEEDRGDPSVMNGLGLGEVVVVHYEKLIRSMSRPPVIMGHSTGGLLTELLLDRGLGVAGVCLSPAPVKGVLRLPPLTPPHAAAWSHQPSEPEEDDPVDAQAVPLRLHHGGKGGGRGV
jgi:pimeloyl-ACP methyl ester carboxylesterase